MASVILAKVPKLPKINKTFESYQFRKITQFEGELFQAFVHRLTVAAQKCEYTDRDRQLRGQGGLQIYFFKICFIVFLD